MRLFKNVLMVGALAAAAMSYPHASYAAAPGVGSMAPGFALHTADGKIVSLAGLRGKIVVVNFFATWCPPCRAETPDLVSAARSFEPRGVVFLGVDVKESPELVQEFAGAKGVGYPIVLDRDGKVNDSYDVRAIPTTYIIGRDGRIVYRQVDQLANAVLSSALNDVIAGRMPNESPLGRRFADVAASGTSQVDALLAQAKAAQAAGNSSAALTAASKAIAAGASANKALDDLQSSDDQSSINYFTSSQQRDVLAAALAGAYELRATLKPGAKTAADDLEQADLLLGQRAEDQERFASAETYYKQAAHYAPKDTKPLDGIYLAAYEQRDYATAKAAAQTEAAIAPSDPESWLTLASSLNSLKQYDEALTAERMALAIAGVDYANHPYTKKHALNKAGAYEVGRVFLKMGRSAIMGGDKDNAAIYLAQSTTIAPGTIVAQQAAEQLAALSPQPVYVAVSGTDNVATNGSEPAKLWVTVRNPAAQTRMVHLAAMNVPKKWVLSFCYDKVCDPYKSDVSLGPNATRRVELQVVPLSPISGAWTMTLAPSGVDQMGVTVDGKMAKASITVLAS